MDAYKTTRPRAIPTPGGIEKAWPGWYVFFDLEEGVFGVELPCLFQEWYGATSGPEEWCGRGL